MVLTLTDINLSSMLYYCVVFTSPYPLKILRYSSILSKSCAHLQKCAQKCAQSVRHLRALCVKSARRRKKCAPKVCAGWTKCAPLAHTFYTWWTKCTHGCTKCAQGCPKCAQVVSKVRATFTPGGTKFSKKFLTLRPKFTPMILMSKETYWYDSHAEISIWTWDIWQSLLNKSK